MANPIPSWCARALLCAAVLAAAGCGSRHAAILTVDDLMDDRQMLDGLLLKCNQSSSGGVGDPACDKARIASERLAARQDALLAAARAEEFEHRRESLRLADERRRQDEESRKVDAYHLPFVPADGSPSQGADTPSDAPTSATVASQPPPDRTPEP